MPWTSNHKQKIEEKSTKSSRPSSKVVDLGLVQISNADSYQNKTKHKPSTWFLGYTV